MLEGPARSRGARMDMIERFLNHRWPESAVCEWLGLVVLLALGRLLFGSERGRSRRSLSPRVSSVLRSLVRESVAGGCDSRASTLARRADPAASGLASVGAMRLVPCLSCG